MSSDHTSHDRAVTLLIAGLRGCQRRQPCVDVVLLSHARKVSGGGRKRNISVTRAAVACTPRVASGAGSPGLRQRTDATRAHLHLTLSQRLVGAGRGAEAVAVARRAVKITRRLAKIDPTRESDLAKSLKHLGARLLMLKSYAQAQTATDEAVMIYEQLVVTNPAYEHDLAQSLNDLGVIAANRGFLGKARATIERAIEVYERLGNTHERDLALSLNNLALFLDALGQPDAALGAIERALTIYRRLTQPDSAEHEHNLATTLNTHAKLLDRVGRREEATTGVEKSEKKYRLLASANPALANTAQAVEIQRRLAKANPTAHELQLADQLDNYALVRRKLGKELAEADHASKESAEIRWRCMRHWLDSTVDQTTARPRRPTNKNKARKRR